jgi:hypothetical protein
MALFERSPEEGLRVRIVGDNEEPSRLRKRGCSSMGRVRGHGLAGRRFPDGPVSSLEAHATPDTGCATQAAPDVDPRPGWETLPLSQLLDGRAGMR